MEAVCCLTMEQVPLDYTNRLEEFLTYFIEYFVECFEKKLQSNLLIYAGDVKKAGKRSDIISGIIRQMVGGEYLGAKLTELASVLGEKKNEKNAAELFKLLSFYQKDKANLRRELVGAAFDVFQSFEMQFMRVTTDLGPNKAMQHLAEDAVNRAINYMRQNHDALITKEILGQAVLLGESKLESSCGVNIPFKPGFEIIYKHETSEKKWRTASLYEKAGLVIEERTSAEFTGYYDKKVQVESKPDKYGYRRLVASENWNHLKDKYKDSDLSKSVEFLNYHYILRLEDSEQRTKDILKNINLDDESLSEDRIKELIKEVKDELIEKVQNLVSHGYNREDRTILENILNNLEHFNESEHFEQFKLYIEDVARSIKANREENRDNFNVLKDKQDNYHEINKTEHQKTQELVRELNEAQKIAQIREPVWFDVIEPVKSFTGRGDNLKELHDVLQSEAGQVVISQTTAITGLGGIGKSEIARKYAYDHREDYSNNVIWISAEKKEDLIKSFQRLAEKLNIPIKETRVRNGIQNHDSERDIRCIVEDVYKYFKNTKSLFIFDNAEENNTINDFLPPSSPVNKKPFILITSRNQEWDVGEEGSIKVVNLGGFTPEEAAEFIKKAVDVKPEDSSRDEEINKLAYILQYFPLALRQATAYIKEKSERLRTRGSKTFGFHDYIKEYEKEEQKTALLSYKSRYGGNRYFKTVFTTWQVTLKSIEGKGESGKQALELLDIMAYFSPDKILIEAYFPKLVEDEEKLWTAIELLKQYSMINVDEGVASIHRLVQEVIRKELENQKIEVDVLKKALTVIKDSEDDIQIASVWRYATKHSELVAEFYRSSLYGEMRCNALHVLAGGGNDKAIEDILYQTRNQPVNYNINSRDRYNETPLHKAAGQGHQNVVEFLIEKGASVNVEADGNLTPLHCAALGGHKEVAEFLIEKGANVNFENSKTLAPLDYAALGGHKEVAEFLIEKGANVNGEAVGNFTPLHYAVSRGHKHFVEFLIEKGANVKFENSKSLTPLHCAAIRGYKNIVEFLIEKGANVNIEDYDNRTPLHCAASRGRKNVVEFLIEKGADVNVEADKNITPLHSAAIHGHKHIVEFLIEKGANVNGEAHKNHTPLHFAASQGHKEVAEILIEKGANVNVEADKNITPLHFAAMDGSKNVIEFLIEKGANVNVKADNNITPLHCAVIRGYKNVVEFLIEKGADVNVEADKNITPLHCAAIRGHKNVVEFLLKKGANINVEDEENKTPLHYAALGGHRDMVEFLVENGANVNVEDDNNSTPWHWAIERGQDDIVEFLIEKGANIDVGKGRCAPPFHFAAIGCHEDILEYWSKFWLRDFAEFLVF